MSTANSGVSAVILAAGSSRRMGSPKQLMRLGEKSLLEHVLASVRAARVAEIILVLGFAADQIRQRISTQGLVIVSNQEYQQGMGTSLRVGLSAVSSQAQGALVILADQPFVRPATLDALIAYHAAHKPQVVIPLHRGFRGNPVLLDRSVFPEVMQLKGDVGCRAIFGSHTKGIHKLPVEDPGILLDADTLADFRMLAAMLDPNEAGLLPNTDLEERPLPLSTSIPPELVIVGRDAMATALVRLARMLGFRISLVDPFLTLAEMPEADRILRRLDFCLLPENENRYSVIASRGQFDEEALEQALGCSHRYIALVASKSRREELLRILQSKGLGEGMLDRLRAPAGLEIGAETPEEIALSIIAQIVSERKSQNSATETRNKGEIEK